MTTDVVTAHSTAWTQASRGRAHGWNDSKELFPMVIPAQISTDIRWIGRDSWGLQGAVRPGATAASLAASGSPSACYLTVEWMALAGRVPHGEGAAEWPDPMVAGTRAGPAPVLGADAGPPRVRPPAAVSPRDGFDHPTAYAYNPHMVTRNRRSPVRPVAVLRCHSCRLRESRHRA